jgi:hemerythrin
MNRDHADALVRVQRLERAAMSAAHEGASIAEVEQALLELVDHTREHFLREEDEMRRSSFPPYNVHRGEHERLLAILGETVSQWRIDHDAEALARWVRMALAPWLVEHVQTLDAVTAAWIDTHG